LWSAPVTVSAAEVLAWTADPQALVGLFGHSIQVVSSDDGNVLSQFLATSATEDLYGSSLPLGLPAFRCSAQAGLCAVGVDEIVGVAPTVPGQPPQPLLGAPRVKVWSLEGVLYQDLAVPNGGVAADVAVSADGQFLAIADGTGDVQVFQISDGSLVNTRHYSGTIF
jgi:hypothetical protein